MNTTLVAGSIRHGQEPCGAYLNPTNGKNGERTATDDSPQLLELKNANAMREAFA